jgi:ribosomal protein S18 acetylase RimI-like enzyme
MGLGKQCLDFADGFAAEADLSRIWLQAMAYRDDVCRFYQKNGYAVCGENFLSGEKLVAGREKMLIMQKQVSIQCT